MMEPSSPPGWVSEAEFSQAVKLLPLVSVDLMVVNARHELLLGKRENRPAQGWWFTPGGRIRKGEEIPTAIARVWVDELGQTTDVPELKLLGAWDHIYDDSAFSVEVSTHYVNLPHVMLMRNDEDFDDSKLPLAQHSQWQWMPISQAETSTQVHPYVRIYAKAFQKTRPDGC